MEVDFILDSHFPNENASAIDQTAKFLHLSICVYRMDVVNLTVKMEGRHTHIE